tara:strand:+ start:3278 stop:3775 length:498 start_codon:yes stop_codon:yes gene_type:complete
MSHPPDLIMVRDKIRKWNDNFRITIYDSKIEVHNWLADFNSKWDDVNGEIMSMNKKVNAYNLDIEINNILNFYADWIQTSKSEYTASVLEPGNILEVTIDQVKAPIKNCKNGCWDKINHAVDQRSQQLIQKGDQFKTIRSGDVVVEVSWNDCKHVLCESCQKIIN